MWAGTMATLKCDRVTDIRYQKPVFISELGGGALYGHHGSPKERFNGGVSGRFVYPPREHVENVFRDLPALLRGY